LLKKQAASGSQRVVAAARSSRWPAAGFALILALGLLVLTATLAGAGPSPVGLGTTQSFSVLGGQGVTNTGPTILGRDLGTSPNPAITGFPPGIVLGTIHAADAVAAQAQSDLTTAYNDAAGRACDVVLTGQDLGGLTLTSGTYCFSSSAQLTGTVTLDAQGDPNAVFIFQVGSMLTTASASTVDIINSARSCNVFWQIGSSATLGTTTEFVGNVFALTSISATTGARIDGRLLARNGSVTLDSNVIISRSCAVQPSPSSGSPTTPPGSPPPGSPSPGSPSPGSPQGSPSTSPLPAAPPSSPPGGGSGTGGGPLASTGISVVLQAVAGSVLVLNGFLLVQLGNRRERTTSE
jgi:hypothetical protein